MRSFLFASAAFCLTAIVSGCDAPVEPTKPAAPTAAPLPAEPGKDGRQDGRPRLPAPAPREGRRAPQVIQSLIDRGVAPPGRERRAAGRFRRPLHPPRPYFFSLLKNVLSGHPQQPRRHALVPSGFLEGIE